MSSVILTDIIQNSFLSNTNNKMHVLATETEELVIYNGHLFIQATQYCPCSHKKLSTWEQKQFIHGNFRRIVLEIVGLKQLCMVTWLVHGLTIIRYAADRSAMPGYMSENISHVCHSCVLYRHKVAWSRTSLFLVLSSSRATSPFKVSWATRSTSV